MDNTKQNQAQVSIIIPTYNESENIIPVLKSIGDHLPRNVWVEAIVVDDNSPDGTGKLLKTTLLIHKMKLNILLMSSTEMQRVG